MLNVIQEKQEDTRSPEVPAWLYSRPAACRKHGISTARVGPRLDLAETEDSEKDIIDLVRARSIRRVSFDWFHGIGPIPGFETRVYKNSGVDARLCPGSTHSPFYLYS